MIVLLLLAILGFALSVYAYFVEINVARDEAYKPICDISDRMSCTKLFASQYAKLVGIPNTMIGMLFYILIFVLACFSAASLIFYISIAACIVTVGLAYISHVMVRSFCLLCTSIYIVNILLLVVSYMNL